ncbi:MAG: carboxypeptidase-like regulatory domain-containing protein [Candidatus Caldarchaeum sp.]
MKTTTLTLLVILLMLPHVTLSQSQQQVLTVLVTTGDGAPRSGLTVTVQAENFRETAVTNATGYAVLRQLSPGTYQVTVSLQNIELIRRTISFPETSFIREVAPLSTLYAKVVDTAGKPVPNFFVNLLSPTGLVSVSQRTNSTGVAVFRDIPFSNISSIGGVYRLSTVKQGITIGSVEKLVEKYVEEVTISAGLVNANFSLVDSQGVRIKLSASLSLRAGNVTERIDVVEGFASVTQLISSAIVGSYNTSLSVKLSNKDVVVYNSLLNIDTYGTFTLSPDVGELVIKVLDPDGNPVKGIGILVGASGYGNFTGGVADQQGQFSVGIVPLSKVVGDYQLSVFRGRSLIQVEQLSLSESKVIKEVKLTLTKTSFRIVDYTGSPLSSAMLSIKDTVTGRTVNTTIAAGEASADFFPGPNEVLVTYRDRVVFQKVLELSSEPQEIRVTSVNFLVSISVLDSLGQFVEGLRVKVYGDGRELLNTVSGSSPVKITLELPADVVVDVFSGENLLARERRYAAGPEDVQIRFVDTVALGNVLLPIQLLASVFLAAVLAGLLAAAFIITRSGKQR